MKVLFIGGTGVISSACSELAVTSGIDLYVMNRGQSSREIPKEANVLIADVRDKDSVKKAIDGHEFDVVVNWLAFEPEHVQQDIELFEGKIKQYVFISSASVYETPKEYPVTESNPAVNPFWEYSQQKIACEEALQIAYKLTGFPTTIVRPSHTYDETMLPFTGGFTVINRMMQGKKVIVHGDGTSLWTLTHNSDFAKGFVPLLGNQKAINEIYHITGDEWQSWNQIFSKVAKAFGRKPDIVHIPSDFINEYDQKWGAGLLGDKSVSMIFDNSKIREIVPGFKAEIPFDEGVKSIAKWYKEDPSRQLVNQDLDQTMDRIIEAFLK